MEHLSEKEMLPANWQPKCNRMFYVELDDVESYLVKRVEIPSLKKNLWGYGSKLVLEKELVIVCHSADKPCTESQVQTLAKRSGRLSDIVVKQLNPEGLILGRWIFKQPKLSKFDINNFDYDDSRGIGELKLAFNCSEVVFE